MPIEIRELIIQAKMDRDQSSSSDDIWANDQVGLAPDPGVKSVEKEEEGPTEEEKTEQIIDKCVARIKQWLMEKSQR